MAKCQFPTTKYYDYERKARVDYNCDSKEEDILPSGLCIFHDKNYLKEDKDNRKKHEQKVRDKLMDKVNDSITNNKALHCIGYHLSDIIFEEVNFTKPVYFTECEFQGIAYFSSAKFSAGAYFISATFSGLAYFSSAKFSEKTQAIFDSATFSGEKADFSYAKFSGQRNGIKEKV